MRRLLTAFSLCVFSLWLVASAYVGWYVLPPMLLNAPLPVRTEAQREATRTGLLTSGGSWERLELPGGEGCALEVWHLRRKDSPGPARGIVIYLHGFGDDAWGTVSRAADLPDWDAVCFTFRGRDRNPGIPCTLGAWERGDVTAVVKHFEAVGVPRSRMILAGWSQGAGVALLALSDLEKEGSPLGGALLECPYETLAAAARDHLKVALGPFEILVRPAERLAIWHGESLAHFDASRVSPREVAQGLRTPIALISGDADTQTPLDGVRAIARHHPDLTVVPGAGHCEASGMEPGGWRTWAQERLKRWGF